MPVDDETLAKIALEHGFLTLGELQDCLRQQQTLADQLPLGPILVRRGFLTVDALNQIEAAARPEAKPTESDAAAEDSLFGRILVRRKLVRGEQIRECLELQRRFREEFKFPLRLGEILVRRGYLTRRQVQDTLKEQRKLVFGCEQCGNQITVKDSDPTLPSLCDKCGGRVCVDQAFADAERP